MSTHRCRRCGHRIAFHAPLEPTAGAADYHAQYDQDRFLDALAQTRTRQARLLVGWIRAALPDADALLDLGAGRGWFLEQARRAGLQRCAALDTSAQAVREARERGFEAAQLHAADADAALAAAASFSFRPRVLALLDVVEHLGHALLRPWLARLLEGLGPELELVVVKVPLSDGLLFRTASLLARAGVAGSFEQLYQVGTLPAHQHYFSLDSMGHLLVHAGLEVVQVRRDRDFEPDQLLGRVRALPRLPPGLLRAVGGGAARVIETLALQDAGIFIARPALRRAAKRAG